MRHPDALDTIALIGVLLLIIGSMTLLATKAINGMTATECRRQLTDCQAERDTCFTTLDSARTVGDLMLDAGQRCADHLEVLRKDCGHD